MADDNKIVIPVELQGDDEVKRRIESMSDTVQRAIQATTRRSVASPEDFVRSTDAFKEKYPNGAIETGIRTEKDRDSTRAPNLEKEVFEETNKEVGRSAEVIRLFREAIHTLHPALAEAGIGFGEMTALTYAARGGVVALAAAVGGLLVTALEKAADATNDASSRLGTFTGSGTSGSTTYNSLQETAKQLNVTATTLVAPFEQLLRTNQNQRPDEQLGQGDLREVLSNLVKGLQSERVDPEKGASAITSLLKDIQENGFLRGEALKAFQEIGPRTASTLLEQLDRNKPGSSVYTARDVLGAGREIGPQVNSNLAQSNAQFPDSISTAWGHVKAATERLSEISTGGYVVADSLDAFSKFMDGLGDFIKRAKDKRAEIIAESGPRVLGVGADQENLDHAFKSFTGGDNAGSLAGSAGKLRESFDQLHDSVGGVQGTLEAFANRQKELGALSADASKKQAAIDLKFEPRETASKLAKDQISVQSAEIHLEQAKISGLEAQKGVESAALAPESARNSLRGAQTNYSKALSRFFSANGVDTSALDASNQQEELSNAVDESGTALKKARIEKKYAYLEPQKAELAAEQAQQNIKSAELEKNDSSLKLAKDQAGAPLSHEYAQLRYAQAALDFDKVKVDLLQKILEKIGGTDKAAAEDVKKLTQGETPENSSDKTNGSGPSYRYDESGNKVDSTLIDNYRYNRDHRGASTSGPRGIGSDLTNQPENFSGDSNKPYDFSRDPNYQPPAPGPRSDAGGGQQFSSLSDQFQQFIDAVSSKLSGNGPQLDQSNNPPNNIGVRGDSGGDRTSTDVADLGTAASDAQSSLTSLAGAVSDAIGKISDGSGSVVKSATGGYIRGPGTSTSDSINARLSDKEYVQPADATEHYGVAFMDAVRTKQLPRFAIGGMFSGAARSLTSSRSLGLAGGGQVGPSSAAPQMEHWGTIDMRTNYGEHRVATQRDTMRHISSAAASARNFSTGPKPGWYGGKPR